MHIDPHFKEVRGGVEPWWMARWKARADFLLSVIVLLFYLLRLKRYKAKRVKTRSLQEWVGHFEPKFQGEGVVPGEYFLVSTTLDTFCYPTVQFALSDSKMCLGLVLYKPKNIPQGRPLPPEILAQSDLPTPEGCEL